MVRLPATEGPSAAGARHFGTAGPRALRREIVALLCVKAVGLALIYWAFFGPSVRPHITSPALVSHMLASGPEQSR